MSIVPHSWCLGCFLGVFWWFDFGRVGVCTPLWFRGKSSMDAGLFAWPCVVCATGTYANRSWFLRLFSLHVLVLVMRQMDRTFAVVVKTGFSVLVVFPGWGGGGVVRAAVSQGEVMGRGCRT